MKSIGNISNKYIESANKTAKRKFPKYTRQLINLANRNAKGTVPDVVGSLATLYFPEFLVEVPEHTVDDWEKWYTDREPEAKARAKAKILPQIERLKEAIQLIDDALVDEWLDDLLIDKTYNGLYVQKAVLQKVSAHFNVSYKVSSALDESKGIDGYIGETPISIKPDTYKMVKSGEKIDVPIVFYKKNKNSKNFEVFIPTDLNPSNND
ncbi:MjaI family restriction endonuclease [Sporosarcina thermotolerans]|uniref:MjaI family restriction endonuclease n=1 Tax=Sporosarcina thermotolerans TaxID=633404 RepID=A0AAW9A4W9_9BACL|nr:MjaI family restriction endonuclease [Sporosarcina thermotolerans]MDW0116172.1 MjaI family restriction endonuclease [Sporosarcina thermotolerans]WHT48148.1 MjaI family restriction endonuclease [Sporosarcina thermotolerans]